MERYWIGVASREHILRGAAGGFCQVCHGKKGPLNQMTEGDWIVYYSPKEQFGGKEPCRRFTVIGRIAKGESYLFQMSEDFTPWRRDATFLASKEAPIEPLIDHLSFIKDKQRWGFPFRRGCFSISQEDFRLIASSMGINIDDRSC
jgi:hypothetical protein